jgi:GntR family transcriptional repressor for pyruvate dehydrogenase complex
MKLNPIQKQRVYQNIIEQIKHSIEIGDLKPGERLPAERELAESLSVSRSAVREAISVLASSRLVRIQPGVGVFLEIDANHDMIARLSEILQDEIGDSSLVQLLEVRQAIEGQAAYLAAIRRTPADLTAIQRAFEKLAASVERGRVAAEEDFHFHLEIVKAAYNPMLLETVKLFSDKCLIGLHKSRSESIQIQGKKDAVLNEHRHILQSIESMNPEQAQQMMWTHLHNVKLRYLH